MVPTGSKRSDYLSVCAVQDVTVPGAILHVTIADKNEKQIVCQLKSVTIDAVPKH
jgi:hypothetical protein